jgi:membrane-associated phospholipid phosphatase
MINQPWEIDLILWFQNLGGWLEPVMLFFTWLGFPVTYVVLVSILYWCVDSKLGQRFAIFLLLAGSINEILKRLFHAPRPYWVDSRIRPVGSASTAFGLPSGHAQISVVWIFVGIAIKKWWGWVLSFVLIIMIGLSRIYLGAHSPTQVVVGWILGGVLMIVYLRLERPVINWMSAKSLFRQLLIVVCLTAALLFVGWVSDWLLKDWQIPELWSQNVAPHLKEGATFDPLDFETIAAASAALLGTAAGMILMAHYGGHHAGGTLVKRGLRLFVGIISLAPVLVVYSILGDIVGIPEEPGPLVWSWQFVFVFLLLFFIFYPIPFLFRRLGLTVSPE